MVGVCSVPQAGVEPIPGYVLKHRLGAGGYGEVWLADAPGGLQKAIKLVFGSLDDDRASGELRSLQRIRSVHHPFLLSLERIEIVDRQLVIVTELAESNLLERYQACRRKGLDGIPRDQLLDFLRDTADALDFLWQKHNLQHLDVKPGNLLLIADRIKVADFGLIKDLHEQNQSMISGLTPIYAAPEMFDGRPDLRSDQYSLGIVYIEMLTGKVPFPGRTTGELARQHLSQAPDLESLPPPDRPIVARALAKHPRDRYGSCREFIDKLRQVGSTYIPPSQGRPGNWPGVTTDDDSESKSLTATCHSSMLQTAWAQTAIQQRGARVLAPRLPAAESAIGWQAPRCMFIGLGGIGCRSLNRLRELMHSRVDSRRTIFDHGWLGIDTDPETLDACVSEDKTGRLTSVETVLLRLHKPQEYRNRDLDRFAPISRRWLYNIPRTQRTEGVRPLAALALLDNYELVAKNVALQLMELTRKRKLDAEDVNEPLRVYVVGSAHGGTGSALVCEVAYIVRQIMGNLKYSDYRLSGLISLATMTGDASSNLRAAAAISCLSEIDELMYPGAVYAPLCPNLSTGSEAGRRPFDWISLVDGGLNEGGCNAQHAPETIADAVWIDSHTLVGSTLDKIRTHATETSDDSQSRVWLRTVRTSKIRFTQNANLHRFARWCCNSALQRCIGFLAPVSCGVKDSTVASQTEVSFDSKLTLTPDMEQLYISRILRDLDLHHTTDTSSDDANATESSAIHRETNSTACTTIARRISLDQTLNAQQISHEITWLRKWIRGLFEQRRLSWESLEKLFIRFIARVVDLSETDGEVLSNYITDRREQFERPDKLEIQALRDHLRRLCQVALVELQNLRKSVEQLTRQLRNWAGSIEAELSMSDGKTKMHVSATVGLPFQWKQLFERITSVLDSTVLKYAAGQCFQEQLASIMGRNPADSSAKGKAAAQAIHLSLPELLQLASNLVRRMMSEMKLKESDFESLDNAQGDASQSLDELREFYPQLTECGGRHHRLLMLDAEQSNDAVGFLKNQAVEDLTTLVPSCAGEPPYVICEATELNLPAIITTMLRPNGETLRLAQRLHIRVDRTWLSADRLLQSESQSVV